MRESRQTCQRLSAARGSPSLQTAERRRQESPKPPSSGFPTPARGTRVKNKQAKSSRRKESGATPQPSLRLRTPLRAAAEWGEAPPPGARATLRPRERCPGRENSPAGGYAEPDRALPDAPGLAARAATEGKHGRRAGRTASGPASLAGRGPGWRPQPRLPPAPGARSGAARGTNSSALGAMEPSACTATVAPQPRAAPHSLAARSSPLPAPPAAGPRGTPPGARRPGPQDAPLARRRRAGAARGGGDPGPGAAGGRPFSYRNHAERVRF